VYLAVRIIIGITGHLHRLLLKGEMTGGIDHHLFDDHQRISGVRTDLFIALGKISSDPTYWQGDHQFDGLLVIIVLKA